MDSNDYSNKQNDSAPQAVSGDAVVPGAAKPPVNAGLIVLQWLTYAFWGWTVLSLSVLTTLVISHFLNDLDSGGFMPYGIAAILVLLPLSLILDTFYTKKEPEHKAGPEVWVMVFHAVVFALFGIASLIAAAIALVMLITGSANPVTVQVALYSALIIFVYYALTFVRTLNPAMLRRVTKWYRLIMLVSVGVIALLGIVGPLAKERATKDDRLIVSEIGTVENAVSRYTQDKKRLPDNLKALDFEDDAKRLVDAGLVTYKPEGKHQDIDVLGLASPRTDKGVSIAPVDKTLTNTSGPDEYRYQLCTTFKQKSSRYNKYNDDFSSTSSDDGYQTSLYVYDHPAGNVCYKLKVEVY